DFVGGTNSSQRAIGATGKIIIPLEPAHLCVGRQHWREYIARADTVHPNSLRPVIDGHGFGQQNNPTIRGAISHSSVSSNQPPTRTDVDYRSLAALDHCWQSKLRHQKRALQLAIELFVPLGFRAVENGVGIKNTGVVDQNVHAPKRLQCFIHRTAAILKQSRVRFNKFSLVLNFLQNSVSFLAAPSRERNLGTLAGKEECRSFADSRSSTGYKRDFVVKRHCS